MKEFFAYFFGAGEKGEFRDFSLAHIIPILLAAGVIYLIYRYRDKIREHKHETVLRYFLAFAMIVSEISYYWRLVGVEALDGNATDHLPITICGWVIVFSSFLIIGKSQSLFDIVYFWLFAGTIFALLFPSTVLTFTGPTRFRYYQFWVEHTFGYITVFYMIFVYKMRPTIKSLIKSYGVLVILAVVAFIANDMLPGANYLFMARPESAASILDVLPNNYALRILIMAVAVTALFGVAYLPWFLKDRKAKLAAEKTEETTTETV